MKIKYSKTETFQPISVTFTFETQEELDQFGCLMNYSTILVAAPCLRGAWEIFEKLGADISSGHKRVREIFEPKGKK